MPISWAEGNGGKRAIVNLSDLPAPEQLAYRERLAEQYRVSLGTPDDAAWLAFLKRPQSVQDRAHRRFRIMLFLAAHEAQGIAPGDILRKAAKEFSDLPSRQTIWRWKKAVAGLEPANWEPALAPDFEGVAPMADMAPEAVEFFKNMVFTGGKNGTGLPLKRAFLRTKRKAEEEGWAIPSFATVRRRFLALPAEEQRTLRHGEDAAAASLYMYQPRSTELLQAMEQVELDGREFKVLVRWPDGNVGCPWVILYADRASSKVLGWAVDKSENAEAAARATLHMCETYGIPDLVVTDNGVAFNGQRMAGGLAPTYLTTQQKSAMWDAPGVFKILQIELRNTGIKNGKAKLPESIYSALRHVDNAPEFHGAQRSGPNDPPNPNPDPISLELFEAVLEREIAAFNAEPCRAQQARGGSRDAAFDRLHQGRIKRQVTPLQRRRCKLRWKPLKVRPEGRVIVQGVGYYGTEVTQSWMLDHDGRTVLVGYDPNDYRAPAMICGWDDQRTKGRVLPGLEEVPCFEIFAHGDEEGRRRAVAEKRRVRKLTRELRPENIEQFVEGLRKDALKNPVQRPDRQPPGVVRFTAAGGFLPEEALRPETGGAGAESNRAKLEALVARAAPKEERKASGSTR
ncbi:MAG: hypothetical protein KDA73_01395 [Rhodobacteraceae bacterium]|nr:hypothetical protein [Paracoccaceae bacterium]